MTPAEKPTFSELIKTVYGAYGKAMPEAGIMKAWWTLLEPFPLQVVRAAILAYQDENGEFVPVAAGIAKRCRLMDGRPGAEEAWAIAITSCSEADTVVWTAECAEAFALCQPVLALGDEVGARMAFKEAYIRIVTQARAEQRPAKWSTSLGWDPVKRQAALTRAAAAGLLPPPTVMALLPGPPADVEPDAKARAQLAATRKMLADSAAAKELAREERILAEQRAYDEQSRLIDEQVRQYQTGSAP
jgi:hypothetical protein